MAGRIGRHLGVAVHGDAAGGRAAVRSRHVHEHRAAAAGDVEGEIVRERAIMRKLVVVGSGIAESAYSPNGRDAQQLLDEAEAKIFQIAEGGQRGSQGFTDIKELLPQVAERIDMLFSRDNPSDVTGIPTGFSDLDSMTSGFQGGDLIIVAGRPSMGKTAFVLSMARNISIDFQRSVAFFSLEMSAEQLATRILAEQTSIASSSIRRGGITETDFEKIRDYSIELQSLPLYVDETGGLSISQLTARARRLKRQKGLDLIVVDAFSSDAIPSIFKTPGFVASFPSLVLPSRCAIQTERFSLNNNCPIYSDINLELSNNSLGGKPL